MEGLELLVVCEMIVTQCHVVSLLSSLELSSKVKFRVIVMKEQPNILCSIKRNNTELKK